MEEKKTLEMSEMKYLGVVGKQANGPQSKEVKVGQENQKDNVSGGLKLLSTTIPT